MKCEKHMKSVQISCHAPFPKMRIFYNKVQKYLTACILHKFMRVQVDVPLVYKIV